MKKKLILSIGTLSTLLVLTPIISCSNTSKNYNNSNELKLFKAEGESWSNQILNPPAPVQYQWEASQTKTMQSTADFMNKVMSFYFPKPVGELTPYDFANFVLNFFKQNGGGNMILTMNYNQQTENILLQLQKPLIDMIKSFDGPPEITNSTPRYNGVVLGGILSIGAKLATGSNPIDALTGFWNLFGEYGQEIFGTNSTFELLSTMNTNVMLRNIVGLIEAFPKSSLTDLPIFFGLFKTMANEMSSSVLAQEWAKDNNISKEFESFDKYLIKIMLNHK